MSGQNNVVVNVGMPPIVVRNQPGCLVQLVYFVFIGSWVGLLAITLAYLLFLTVLGIPLGVMIVNKLPYLMALRETEPVVTYYGQVRVPQHNFFVRSLWFFVIGFWVTGIWLILAYVIACTLIGMPIAFWMFDRAPGMLTLHRS